MLVICLACFRAFCSTREALTALPLILARFRYWPDCDRRRTAGDRTPLLYFRLFGHLKRVVYFDSEISNGALELCVTEQ